ncbi:RNA polymerase II largest subunit [Rickenella mellea]|uniref:DNA-directed RNA polymerase n=1 Tax=Rickenella mellea TaxID=50990 RepID=A0A4Y7PHW5_9AGAM|nr:RNA polymerase II largest subunit [Rickenella mellea]
MPYSTFRLNLLVTPPYNANFDVDEMNMHIPQSKETRAELSQIAWVPRQIISSQANKPVMGIVQDTLCGIRKFTLRDSFLDWVLVQNILMCVHGWDDTIPTPPITKPKALWTGKQIISMTIPRGINIHRGSDPPSSNPVGDNGVHIENGELLYSVLEKTVGASKGGLVHIVFREKGPEATQDLSTGLQRVVDFWLFHNGFSIGIGDTIAGKKVMEVITGTIQEHKDKVKQVINDATNDRLKAEPGMTIRESFESLVERELNRAQDTSGQYAQKNLKDDNNVKQMVVAGSKGTFINISQMSVCVGQQSVEGKRIPFGFRHRTLPHFAKDDFSPEARGLTPQEFFLHAMAGREEDVMVCYDGTVRNSLGVIQFIYGEDGMDAAYIEEQSIRTYDLNDKEFNHKFLVNVTDPSGGFLPGALQVGIDDSRLELQQKLDIKYEAHCADRRFLREFVFPIHNMTMEHALPVNLLRVIQNTLQIFHIDRRKPSDLEPTYTIDSVQQLGECLIVVRGEDALSREAQQNATLNFRMHLRATFATRRVLEEFHLTREAFDWVLGEIETKFTSRLHVLGRCAAHLPRSQSGNRLHKWL